MLRRFRLAMNDELYPDNNDKTLDPSSRRSNRISTDIAQRLCTCSVDWYQPVVETEFPHTWRRRSAYEAAAAAGASTWDVVVHTVCKGRSITFMRNLK